MLQFIQKHGNGTNAAKVLGVSRSYVSRLRYGSKVNPTDKILKKLGLIRIVEYKRDDTTQEKAP
jgi:transcriptional regulator with XRE-family HTH domain